MRRLVIGLVWFLVLAVALFLLLQLAIALYIMAEAPKGLGQAALMQSAQAFADAHAGTIKLLDELVPVAAMLLAGFGTLKGRLPGTRRRD